MKKQLASFYPLIVFLVAVILYANTIPNDYNLDDELVTINHRNTSKGFQGIQAIFTEYYYQDEMGYKYGYRPVTHLTFAIEHAIFGESPHISHAVNVLLYGGLCLLIFYLLKALDPVRGPTFALVVALLFAVHPIHTEVVASIKNRDEMLSLFFALLAMSAVFKMKGVSSISKQAGLALAVILAFLASILAKPSSATLLVLLPVLYILMVNQRWSLLPYFLAIIPAGIVGVLLFKRVELTALIMALSILFVLVFQLLYKGNREAFQRRILLFVDSVYFDLLLLVLASLQIVLSYTLQNSVYFVPFFVLACFHLWRLIVKDWMHIGLFIYAFHFLAIAFFYGNFDFIWGYCLFYIFGVVKKNKKHLIFTLILLATYIGVTLYAGDGHGVAAALIVLAYLSPWRKYLVPGLIALMTIISIFDPILFVLYCGILLLVLMHFDWIKLNKIRERMRAVKPGRLAQLSVLFIVSAMFFQEIWNYYYTDTRDLHTLELSELIEVDELIVFEQETVVLSDIDRPLLYVENPIVEKWDWNHRVGLSLSTFAFYIAKMVFPYPLSFYYGYDTLPVVGAFSWQAFIGGILGVIAMVCLVFFRKDKLVVVAILNVLLGLAIYSNFMTPVAGIVGERLAFHASLGFAILMGALLFKWVTKEKILYSLIALFIVPSFAYSMYRNHLWKDGLTLFSHDIKHLDHSAQANALLGLKYLKQVEQTSDQQAKDDWMLLSESYFNRAVEIYPDFINWWLNLGEIYTYQGNTEKAKNAFEHVLKIDPSMYPAYNYLLDIAMLQNDRENIVKYLELLFAQNPKELGLLFDLSAWYYEWGEQLKVIETNNRIIAINSSIPEAYLNKAYAYAAMEDWNNFREEMENAAAIALDHPDYLFLAEKYQSWLD